ncbi:hypothetical protein LINPERPRIM_LOCUS15472 [Linum perenne]
MYAGSAFAVSPSPSALPLPSFSKKKQVSVDDSATRDLRRLLRLDFRSQQATEPQSQQPSISGFPIVTGDGTPPTTRGLTWYSISFSQKQIPFPAAATVFFLLLMSPRISYPR